jgi:murein L,D-transpeptidase YcbB/YkuD
MSIKIRAGVALIAIAVSFTGVVATTPPVHAQGLLDALFKSPAQRKREKEAREQARQEAAAARQVKPVRISGPSYRTYKPDTLVSVDFDKIADPVVTGAIDDMGLAPLGIDPFQEGRPALADLSVRALPEVAEAVVEHYSTHPAYMWVAGTAITDRARAVLDVLKAADEVGLSGRRLQGRGSGGCLRCHSRHRTPEGTDGFRNEAVGRGRQLHARCHARTGRSQPDLRLP